MTDERFARLMAGLLAGDRSALREVYEAYAGLVYALALSITGRREDAEDVTSEVFLRLCDKAGSYRPGGPHKAWLMTITHHLAVDCVRLRERRLPEPGGEAPAGAAESAEEAVCRRLYVRSVLAPLRPEERQVVLLHVMADMTLAAVSRLLGKPPGTVAWLYRTAMKKLRHVV